MIERIQFITVPIDLEFGHVKKPFYSTPPIAFLWLSAYLEQKDVECNILDAYTNSFSVDQILDEIEKHNPNLIGLSVFTVAVYDNLYLAKRIKERFPEIVIVFGGYHVNCYYEEILETGLVDFCVLGEGEVTICELVECLNMNGEVSRVKGIAGKLNGKLFRTEGRNFVQRLDEIPILPYEKVSNIRYRPWCFSRGKKNRYMATVTSKGCPMQCIFCDIGKTEGSKFRHFSAERVLREMESLYVHFGINQVEFLDPLFTTRTKRVKNICRLLIEHEIGIDWACSSSILHANDYEMLEMMNASGCKNIFYGIETGNPEILKQVKKVTPKLVQKVVNMTKKAGMQVHTSFIFGLPGETKATIKETINFAKVLNPDSASFSVAIPFKGTKLYDIYKSKIFVNDYRKFEGAIFRVSEYSPEYIENARIKALREFYLRPRYIMSRLRNIHCWEDLHAHAEIVINLLKGKLGYKIE